MESFDEDRLQQELASFETWKQVAFMLLTSTRMLPNYDRFAAETGRAPRNLASLHERVEQQMPDTERFSSPFTSAALDAATAAAMLLDAVRAPECAEPVEVAGLARDTIDLYVQAAEDLKPNELGFEDSICRHPLMQSELRHQREDLALLQSLSGSRSQEAPRLLEHCARANGSLAANGR